VAMDAAAPLVRDAMLAIAGTAGKLTLPARPAAPAIDDLEVCAVSGMAPGPRCPRAHDHAPRGHAPLPPCTSHHPDGHLQYPAAARGRPARGAAPPPPPRPPGRRRGAGRGAPPVPPRRCAARFEQVSITAGSVSDALQ